MKFYLVISITFVFIGSMKEDIGGVPCLMTGWTEWTKCSKTCGNGTRLRWQFPIYDPENCEGEEIFDSEICNPKCCPVDCDYHYTKWGECNGCKGEDGIQHRDLIISHQPFCGGKECPAEKRIEQSCEPSR